MTAPTELRYLDHFSDVACDATVVAVLEKEGQACIHLDRTILYPQGGGQPNDRGCLSGPDSEFSVENVRFVDGIVDHLGSYARGVLSVGDRVDCAVDEERRALHSRLHSAGHVVDMAVSQCGLTWIPGKGFHFPQGPYVEYVSDNDVSDPELRERIEVRCNELVRSDLTVQCRFVTPDELTQLCRAVPDNIPQNKPTRVVQFSDFAVPCGGTHVRSLSEIGPMTIPKIKRKSGFVRVSYDVQPQQ